MEIVSIYDCLCDRTRLRILNLLGRGELCVCHLQDVLREPQVKISKHLGYLKQRGLVESRQAANWRIYAIAAEVSPLLTANLNWLRDFAGADEGLAGDLARLDELKPTAEDCCGEPREVGGTSRTGTES